MMSLARLDFGTRGRDILPDIIRPPEMRFPSSRRSSPRTFLPTTFPHPSCWRGRRLQPGDQPRISTNHFLGTATLSHVEGDVTAMAHNLRADLDEFLAQGGQ
jgi:hypothetical protein